MARKNYTTEQIIVKLREVELHCNQGKTIARRPEAGITEQTYYRWRKEYGGMNTSRCHAIEGTGKRERSFEEAGSRAGLDISILRDVNSKNF